jgi:dipeptidyl aminopeptidase/acylaminoacyl peptidase
VWSPDGARLAFVSARAGKPQIHILEMSGGEAWAVTALEAGAGEPAWSLDGRWLAFTSTERTAEEKEAAEAEEKAQREAREAPRVAEGGKVEATAEEETVIESLIFRRDGSPGYRDADLYRHIWVVEVEGEDGLPGAPRRVTHGPYNHRQPVWGWPDEAAGGGATLFFTGLRKEDADYTLGDTEIYRLEVDLEGATTEEPVALTDHRGGDQGPMVSPDGLWVAYRTSDQDEPPATYEQTELMVMRPDGSEARRLSGSFDRSVGSGTGHDVAAPVGGGDTVRWAPGSDALLFTAADRGQTHLYRAPLDGQPVERLTSFEQGDVQHFSIARDGTLAAIFSTPTRPFDLHTFPFRDVGLDPATAWQRHTRLNDAVAGGTWVPYEEIVYPAFDERQIQGWILKPPGFDPERKYPAILYIHGGPHSMYGTTFFHEFQMLAHAGYVVLITNPRGSTGYGLDFATSIQYAYPGDDVKDLMTGVDVLLAKGYVDADRLGVAGGSGGGLLTSWIVGHTDRFAAAVAQRNVTNWYSFAGTSDVGYMSTRRWFRGGPWGDAEADYLNRSPIRYADRITTPLLLIHSDQDYRTPLEQSEQLYAALKIQKKEARLVVFPNESHGLSRGGRPSHRVARLQHILEWFDRFLKGEG